MRLSMRYARSRDSAANTIATTVRQRTTAAAAATVTVADCSEAGDRSVVVQHVHRLASQECQRRSFNSGGIVNSVCDAVLLTTSLSLVQTPSRRMGRETKRPGAGAVPTTHDVVGPWVHPSRTQRATTVTIRAHVITHTAAGCKRQRAGQRPSGRRGQSDGRQWCVGYRVRRSVICCAMWHADAAVGSSHHTCRRQRGTRGRRSHVAIRVECASVRQ